MKLDRFNPSTRDQELLDHVYNITTLVNEGRLSFQVSDTSPTTGTNATEGELRIVRVGTGDLRLYAYVSGSWYYAQLGRASISGWGYIEITGGGPSAQTKAISFPVTFDSPPFVLITYIGVKTTAGAPTAPEDLSAANTLRAWAAYAPTTTGFTAAIYSTNGSAMTDGHFEGFAYTAFVD